mgnify:CR=1 FL=1
MSQATYIANRQGERLFTVYASADDAAAAGDLAVSVAMPAGESGVAGAPDPRPPAQRPLALLIHGFSDVHDSPHMRAALAGLQAAGYDVLRWDATNSWGRSGGSLELATWGNAVRDAEDVLEWACHQAWWRQPVTLAGHSLGAAVALTLAVARPGLARRVILVAPPASGRLMSKRLNPALRTLWWMTGRLPDRWPRRGQARQYFRYQLLHDGLAYDGVKLARRLTIPAAMIAAAADITTPPVHARLIYEAVPVAQQAGYIEVPDAGHVFSEHLPGLRAAVQAAAQAL